MLASLLYPTALAAVAFYQCMPAAQSGPGKLGGCAGLVHGWRAGAASLLGFGENCGPDILSCRPFPAQGVGAGQAPFASLALLPSVCAPGQACLVLSRTLGQLQASMTYFLCITPSSSLCVKRTAPFSPAKDRIGSLTLCFLYLGGSELVETQTLLANVRVHNPGHRDI